MNKEEVIQLWYRIGKERPVLREYDYKYGSTGHMTLWGGDLGIDYDLDTDTYRIYFFDSYYDDWNFGFIESEKEWEEATTPVWEKINKKLETNKRFAKALEKVGYVHE